MRLSIPIRDLMWVAPCDLWATGLASNERFHFPTTQISVGLRIVLLCRATMFALAAFLLQVRDRTGNAFIVHEVLFGLTNFVFPVITGMVMGKRLSRPANLSLVVAVWYAGNVALGLIDGEFRPLGILFALFGDPGSLLLLLIFLFVALRFSKRPVGQRG